MDRARNMLAEDFMICNYKGCTRVIVLFQY